MNLAICDNGSDKHTTDDATDECSTRGSDEKEMRSLQLRAVRRVSETAAQRQRHVEHQGSSSHTNATAIAPRPTNELRIGLLPTCPLETNLPVLHQRERAHEMTTAALKYFSTLALFLHCVVTYQLGASPHKERKSGPFWALTWPIFGNDARGVRFVLCPRGRLLCQNASLQLYRMQRARRTWSCVI